MKASNLREKGTDDLRELQKSLSSDVFQNRLKNFTNRLDDTSAIRKTRRELARVMTLLRETELGLVKTSSGDKAAAPKAEAKAPAQEAAEAKPKKTVAKKAAADAKPKKTAKKSEAKKS
jgi:large subunit ribosomal protein L29